MGKIDPDFPSALPAASVDSRKEGIALRTILCVKGYEPKQYLFKGWKGGVEAMFEAGEKIEREYQKMKKRSFSDLLTGYRHVRF